MKEATKNFLVKQIIIDTFNANGNGLVEERLRLKAPYLLKTDNGTNEEFCKSLRELFFNLITSSNKNIKVLLPTGTRMVHIKTNASKKMTISCVVIFKEDLRYEDSNARTGEDESDIDWDL